jgi:hypothetical protein
MHFPPPLAQARTHHRGGEYFKPIQPISFAFAKRLKPETIWFTPKRCA